MNVLFDNDGLRMWMDGHSPIVFFKFSSMPSDLIEPKTLIKKCRSALQSSASKYKNLYSLIDMSECTGKCSVKLAQLCFNYFPQLLEQEVKYVAFVNTASPTSHLQEHLEQLNMQKDRTAYGCYSDFFVALGRINNMRQTQSS